MIIKLKWLIPLTVVFEIAFFIGHLIFYPRLEYYFGFHPKTYFFYWSDVFPYTASLIGYAIAPVIIHLLLAFMIFHLSKERKAVGALVFLIISLSMYFYLYSRNFYSNYGWVDYELPTVPVVIP